MRGGASRPTASGDECSAAGQAGFGACLPQLPRGNERTPGPVNPSLRAATKGLRACEPEPPRGNERAPGPVNPSLRAATKRPPVSAEPEALCKVSLSDFWLLFRKVGAGREGFESLRRLPPAVMLPRAGARSGRGSRTSERVGPAWGPSWSCSRFYSRLPSSSRPSSPTSATMWVAPACSSSSREP